MNITKIRGFYPYLILVFMNTFVDLGHKILIQDTVYQTSSGATYTILSAIINALILLPYILIFTPSGFIADKFPKAQVLRVTALAAIPLTMLVTVCYYYGFFWGAYCMTLLLAIQSVLNSPAKYGYIKEIFGKEHISQANALVQTLIVIAILGSTFVFTYMFSHYIHLKMLAQVQDRAQLLQAFAPLGFVLVFFASLEAAMAFLLPKKEAADPDSKYHFDQYVRGKYTATYLAKASANHVIITCIFGLAVFWAVNQVLLACYGAFLKEEIGNVSVLFAQGSLAIGGIGLLFGALYAGKVSRGFIETGLIPASALGISVGLFLLPFITNKFLIVLLFFCYGFFGGMLIVPLNSLIQFNAGHQELGKILSANNFVQNCFMFGFLILTVLATLVGIQSINVLYALFVIAVAMTVYAVLSLPQSLVRYLLYFVVSKFYSLQVYQLNNLPSTGGVLLLGNHISYIDWAILQIACPRPIRFVMDRVYYDKGYFKWLLKQFRIIPISQSSSKEALQAIHTALNNGEVVALFPEGRLSRNGQLGIFKTGFEKAAQDANAVIVPFYLHGLWGAKTSHASEHYKQLTRMTNRNVSVIYGEAMNIHSKAPQVRQRVQELSIRSWKFYMDHFGSIQQEWLRQAKRSGGTTVLIDSSSAVFSAYKLLAAVMFFSKTFSKKLKSEQNIGIILPASAAGVIANLSCLCLGKTIVNLNYLSGEAALKSAIKQTNIKTIISSTYFLEKLKARGLEIETMLGDSSFIFLEKYKNASTKISIARNLLLAKFLPTMLLNKLYIKKVVPSSPAVILFSSGSEGSPKGVELTHANILSNIKQSSSIFGLEKSDTILSSLPLFHAFGLTVTTLMPLVEGIRVVCYPDPSNSLAIAKLIYRYNITLFCATSTFLSMYARNAKIHPLMLSSLRIVVAGAEKLSLRVYEEFKKKFNVEVYEGYGATELAPVASCNLPDVLSPEDWHVHQANKPGTVGLPLPGSAFRVVDPDTMKNLPTGEAGLILIGGTQVMRGYLNNPDKTKEVLVEEEDLTWYKTGDKGFIDKEGYLTIVDRYSRFAKIGGEMVGLGQVEEQIKKILPESDFDAMALAIPDSKKGEQIILMYSGKESTKDLMDALKKAEAPKLYIPTEFISIDALDLEELPKLPTGKKDYVSAKKLLLEKFG